MQNNNKINVCRNKCYIQILKLSLYCRILRHLSLKLCFVVQSKFWKYIQFNAWKITSTSEEMSDTCVVQRRSHLNKAWLTGEMEKLLLAVDDQWGRKIRSIYVNATLNVNEGRLWPFMDILFCKSKQKGIFWEVLIVFRGTNSMTFKNIFEICQTKNNYENVYNNTFFSAESRYNANDC